MSFFGRSKKRMSGPAILWNFGWEPQGFQFYNGLFILAAMCCDAMVPSFLDSEKPNLVACQNHQPTESR